MIVNEQLQVSSSGQKFASDEASTAEAEVRILLVGDSNVGKTSLIDVLVYDRFSDNVPVRSDTIQFPREFSEDGVLTQIMDFSARVQSEEELRSMIKEANAICVVYSVEDLGSEERVTSYWLPLIQETLGGNNHNCTVLLVANKSDHQNGGDHIAKMAPTMNDYLEIETVVECSAKITKNVSEIFYYAQKAVVYPFRPLFSVEKRELSMKCQKAITRIFKLCDANNDGLLSDDELKKYQMISFGVPLTSAAIEDVKKLISEYESDMVMDNAITLDGFRYLHQMFIQKGRHDTVWTVLKRFGYDLNLQLRQEYLLPKISIPKGSSVEPSNDCLHFIQKLFKKHDEDYDQCLSTTELRSLFSVCPTNPWTDEMLNSVELNREGWITYNGYINLWMRNFLMDLSQTMGNLAYLGFSVEYGSLLDAFTITQDRKKDIMEKSTKRRAFKCHVIGPRNAGKTVFCRSFVGKCLQDVARLSKKQLDSYVINSVLVKSEIKHLLIQEIDLDSPNDKLSQLEKSAADVVCLLYDSTDPNSFAYCAELYLRNFRRLKLPCLFVATKFDRYEVEQFYGDQPTDFCRTYQLPRPYYFSENDIGNQSSEVFSILATMATYPHLKSLFFVRESGNLLSIVTSTALVAALVGFFVFKAVRG